jgi:radical SAM protein with 4Fe4S-binding SPASM domain
MSYKNRENDEVVKNILNRTFFSAWKDRMYLQDSIKYENYGKLELQLNAKCNLDCKYCYYAKYSDKLYPKEISNSKLVLNNLSMLLKWLEKNHYFPEFDLFSGEALIQKEGLIAVEMILDFFIKNKDIIPMNKMWYDFIGILSIPTNFSWILDKNKVNEIDRLLTKAKENKISFWLSISDDGKYCNENRPFKNSTIRTEEYYRDMFLFAKKWKLSFHPMIYSHNIEKWVDNFLWFQDSFKKYDISWDSLYLLEVRNEEWSKRQLKEYYKFIRFVVRWSYEKLNLESKKFVEAVHKKVLFNMFTIFGTNRRGISCSIQSFMQLRLGDLTTTLCHRNSYKGLNLFKFLVENNEITDIEALNPGMMIAMYSMDRKNQPFCETCPINKFCIGQCLGAMFETNQDNFMPIPTVCALEHAKVAAILDEIIELGLFDAFSEYYNGKGNSFFVYKDYLKGNNLWK